MTPNARIERLTREADASPGTLRAAVVITVALLAAAVVTSPDTGAPVMVAAPAGAAR